VTTTTITAITTVWSLAISIGDEDDDFVWGRRTLHHTREGAVKAFEEWLEDEGIPREVAYEGATPAKDGSIGNDYYGTFGDYEDSALHWYIQEQKVRD
jgi:hypothetical protein